MNTEEIRDSGMDEVNLRTLMFINRINLLSRVGIISEDGKSEIFSVCVNLINKYKNYNRFYGNNSGRAEDVVGD